MKNIALIIIISLLLLTFQTTFLWRMTFYFFDSLGWTTFSQIKIEFPLIIVIFMGFYKPIPIGIPVALLLGYFMDLHSFPSYGIHPLLYTLILVITRVISNNIDLPSKIIALGFVFAATLLEYALIIVVFTLSIPGNGFTLPLLKLIVPQALLNTLFAAPVFFILARITFGRHVPVHSHSETL